MRPGPRGGHLGTAGLAHKRRVRQVARGARARRAHPGWLARRNAMRNSPHAASSGRAAPIPPRSPRTWGTELQRPRQVAGQLPLTRISRQDLAERDALGGIVHVCSRSSPRRERSQPPSRDGGNGRARRRRAAIAAGQGTIQAGLGGARERPGGRRPKASRLLGWPTLGIEYEQDHTGPGLLPLERVVLLEPGWNESPRVAMVGTGIDEGDDPTFDQIFRVRFQRLFHRDVNHIQRHNPRRAIVVVLKCWRYESSADEDRARRRFQRSEHATC